MDRTSILDARPPKSIFRSAAGHKCPIIAADCVAFRREWPRNLPSQPGWVMPADFRAVWQVGAPLLITCGKAVELTAGKAGSGREAKVRQVGALVRANTRNPA